MALERKDNIGDTSSTTGTGTLDLLAAAQSGARIFAGNVTSGATVRYDIRSSDNTEWEIGEGVFTDGSPDTLTRVTVYASSNSGSLVNFSAGTKNVSMVATARDFTGEIAPANLLKNGNFINNSTNGYGSTPDDWTSSNANPVQGGIPALTKQNLIDILGVTDAQIEGLWPLNESSGNALDLSSNAYNLTDTNTVAASSDGLMASARDFELANSEYFTISLASATALENTGDKTFICFVKPESIPASQMSLMMMSDSGVTELIGIRTDTTTGAVSFYNKISELITSDVLLTAGKWNMIVAVGDVTNNIKKIWVNGIKKSSATCTTSGTASTDFAIGRLGAAAAAYYDGLMQNAIVLSTALTDNQVKKLFAATMYKGQKIRRATTNAYAYQQLPQDLVERLRGKTVALRADLYQEVASTAQISIHQTMADATTDETIISATDATTGSWLSKVATGTLEADVVTVEIRIKHSTSDGNTWFKNVSLYEGSTLLPYDHSKEDWSRFPRLLKMDIPAVISGYQFEEGRAYTGFAPTYTGFSVNPTGTLTWSIRGTEGIIRRRDAAGGTSNATGFTMSLPFVPVIGNTGIPVFIQDNGANASTPGHVSNSVLSTTLNVYKTFFQGTFTASGGKDVFFDGISLQIA